MKSEFIPVPSTFGTYVDEQSGSWVATVEQLATPIEAFGRLIADEDAFREHMAKLHAQLAAGKFFLLSHAKSSIVILCVPGLLSEEQIDTVWGVFDELKGDGELELYESLRALRPKPRERAPMPTGHAAAILEMKIRQRIEPLQPIIDEYFLLRSPEKRMDHLSELVAQLKKPWGRERRFLLLQEKRRIHLRYPNRKPKSKALQGYQRRKTR